MRIEIPENTQTFGAGANCITALSSMQCWLELAQRVIDNRYKGCHPINDLLAFELGAYKRVIVNLRSFTTLCQIGEDFNSCCTLARSIADSICALKLIYEAKNPDENTFRHYLYILDGVSERYKLLPENIRNNGRITEIEYEQLKSQCNTAKRNCVEVIEFCERTLSNHPITIKFNKFANEAIKFKAWKYKSYELTKRGKIELYSWKDMYELLDSRDSIVSMYSTYFSQFVHGLSISCVPCLKAEDNIDSIASVGVCLQGQVRKRLEAIIDEQLIRSVATNEDMLYLLSLYSPEKRSQIIDKAFKFSQND